MNFPGPTVAPASTKPRSWQRGFAYREVRRVADCPPCFSRVIASYALSLNDAMWDDELRQELLVPFVTRLAGTADAKESSSSASAISRSRQRSAAGLTEHAERCESVNSLVSAADAAASAQTAANAIEAVVWDARSAANATICAGRAAAYAGDYAARVPRAASYVCDNAARTASGVDAWRIATAITGEAIGLGRSCDPIEVSLVAGRLEAVKRRAAEREMVL